MILSKTTCLKDRFDYVSKHVVTETTKRELYHKQLWKQLEDAKINIDGNEVKLASIESFARDILYKGELITLYFKMIKHER